jgi:glycosyltransferase involved in cell wall biosynthesis
MARSGTENAGGLQNDNFSITDMRIAIMGSRGIPNQYGGFEQFAANAAPALVNKGHEVYAYNSSMHPYKGKTWKNVHIIHCYDPEERIGTAGQFIYDFNCIVDARKRHYDVILQLGYTSNSIWAFLYPKKPVLVTNMDGLEWKRSKYSAKVQRFLQKAEKWAVTHSDYLIADSKGIQQYLWEKYNKPSEFIAYGATLIDTPNDTYLREKKLHPFEYDLVLARMEPENNIEPVIEAHLNAAMEKPLVIVGGYSNKFGTYLHTKYSCAKIQFWGAVYDIEVLNCLRYYAYLYFHGHSVGGTNPSLLEAMASYSLIAAHDNVFNKSILGPDAFYFSSANDIEELLKENFKRADYQGTLNNNANKIKHQYSWDNIINHLEKFLTNAVEESTKLRK